MRMNANHLRRIMSTEEFVVALYESDAVWATPIFYDTIARKNRRHPIDGPRIPFRARSKLK
jgi:hypothetical protein